MKTPASYCSEKIMKSTTYPSRRPELKCIIFSKTAFTLIELLTVIAIIGILAAIIIPVVGRVRDSARATQCLSNLRQLGVALNMFVADNKSRFPLASASTGGGVSYPANTWWYYVNPYISGSREMNGSTINQVITQNIWRCPKRVDSELGSDGPSRASYKMSMCFNFLAYPQNSTAWVGKNPTAGVSVSNIAAPSQLLCVSEGKAAAHFTTWDATASDANRVEYRHSDRTNCMFADGHVASFTSAQLQEKWAAFYPTPF